MAAEIGPGTLLECIKADTMLGQSIVAGAVYTCTDTRGPDGGQCTLCGNASVGGVHVAEAPFPTRGVMWCLCCFRPLSPRSKHVDALLEKHRTPAKEPEPA